jgi:5-methyltetrahydropteroyltriglutamate--homocysteine methyltransferase
LPRPSAKTVRSIADAIEADDEAMPFANLAGCETGIAGADCGFSSQALDQTEFHNTVVREKFKAARKGADIATKQLWAGG